MRRNSTTRSSSRLLLHGTLTLAFLAHAWLVVGGSAGLVARSTWPWTPTGAVPHGLLDAAWLGFGVCFLLARSVWPAGAVVARAAAALALALAAADALSWYRLWAAGQIQSALPIPMSLLLAGLSALWLVSRLRRPRHRSTDDPHAAPWLKIYERAAM